MDRVITKSGESQWHVQFNTGTGFRSLEVFSPVEEMVSGSGYEYPRKSTVRNPITGYTDVMDMNGDGVVDRVQSRENEIAWKVQLNKNSAIDLLEGRGEWSRG